jgi:hypothetical protein
MVWREARGEKARATRGSSCGRQATRACRCGAGSERRWAWTCGSCCRGHQQDTGRYVTAAAVGAVAGIALAALLLASCEATDGMRVIDPTTRRQFAPLAAPLVVAGMALVGAVGGVVVCSLRGGRGPELT